MSVGMVDAQLSRNKSWKSVVTVPFLIVSFRVQIFADPKIFPFGIALLPPYKAKKERCVSPISCVLEQV